MDNNTGGNVAVVTGAGSGLGGATALSRPEVTDVNEILFRPTRREL